jgi:hypothetical protein
MMAVRHHCERDRLLWFLKATVSHVLRIRGN